MITSVTLAHSQKQSQSMSVSFGIFKPNDGCDIDDILVHMTAVAASLEKSRNINVAILRCLDCSWAAVFAVVKEGSQSADRSDLNLPEAAEFIEGLNCEVKIVNSGFFRLNSQQTSKGKLFAQLSLGDVVSLRRIRFSSKRQDMVSYSCVAILKAYFNRLKGVYSYSFYDSLDGKRIIGLAVWDSIQSALAMLKYPDNNPALPFWKGAGAKQLKYHVCQVVYATDTCPIKNCSPGFKI
ncbi:uncharacterized protein LOC131074389 [Cryptomeria japonica]|uniref:uncharacterized protein LOC131074389 n=1 Tax=Cryptomeria japonica TaxID=3369 RepID=UPI0027DA4B54|nr:uncharacterized protein LOC131074389 [Cryptomeria japonica]